LKKLEHLAEIYKAYDTFVIDLWGVMHNGIQLNKGAIEVADNLSKNNKKIIFLSNAPRPNKNVINFLKKLNMDDKYLKHVFTSGEAAINSLRNQKFGDSFFHLGPERDTSLFEDFKEKRTNIKSSDFILCTGLFDDHTEDLDYYKKLLVNSTSKRFVCTNPDLVVHRGNKEEYCAGTLAKIFKDLGGQVVYFGKPYKEIYDIILTQGEKAFIIGDNLNTDIKGANNLKLDSLFITNGIHRSEFKDEKELDELLKKYNVKSKYFQNALVW